MALSPASNQTGVPLVSTSRQRKQRRKHHETRASCLPASGGAEHAPTTGKRFSKPRVLPEQEAYERLRWKRCNLFTYLLMW